ncbi:MAG: phenylalanine--tRNA ligase subunit beta [Rhodospirillaceae bacterium]|jgi:phenylalanyl-tRNA synthetase beta chain|nr:phenylalanine--tRNA ligase subunit beta [Rhodospirillaceae bacterium]
MKFTISWLKRHLDINVDVEDIVKRLTMLGFEVESFDDFLTSLDGFVIGQVIEVIPHPNADSLQLCRVSIGSETLQIVCGATNVKIGLKVAVALPGSKIPATSKVLKKSNVRGIESQAMMCSDRELLIGENNFGIIELPSNAAVGERLSKALDPMIDVNITPNRTDCFCVRGIARDLEAAGIGKLRPLLLEPLKNTFASPINVSFDFPNTMNNACYLFAGRVIRGLHNGESPTWLKDLLNAVGLHSISALVDITNYFTLDLARPLHVFDASKLSGNIIVRSARSGEIFVALNGKEYELEYEMTVIADDIGPQSLAGVIGGDFTKVSSDTTDVFLESAYFDKFRTADTGKKLKIDNDTCRCFERGIDPNLVIDGMELATRMIIELCGGEASEPIIVGAVPSINNNKEIKFYPYLVEQLCGVTISENIMLQKLEALGCTIRKVKNFYLVMPPYWRTDLKIEQDLVEEITRLHGYENIPTVALPRPETLSPIVTTLQRRISWIRRNLAARGLVETVTWSFMSSDLASMFGEINPSLKLINPISSNLDLMRPSVLANLVIAVGHNAEHGLKNVALFELGPEFHGDREEDQKLVVSGIRSGHAVVRHWAETVRSVDIFDVKADIFDSIVASGGSIEGLHVIIDAPCWYHPGRSGTIKLGSNIIAVFGEIHPRILDSLDIKELVVGFELYIDALPSLRTRTNKNRTLLKISPLQAIERDFAFVVDNSVSADAVIRAAKSVDKALISDIILFDLYKDSSIGNDKKSLGIQVTIQPTKKTLTEIEIEEIATRINNAVNKATGGMLRK